MHGPTKRELGEPTPEVVAVVVSVPGVLVERYLIEEVMRPRARIGLGDWLRTHSETSEVAAVLDRLRRDAGEPRADIDRLAGLAERWMDDERRSSALTTAQALFWQFCWQQGTLDAELADDAVAALQCWADDRRALFTFSAWPAAVQSTLLRYSSHGDLADLFSGLFDRRMAPGAGAAGHTAVAALLGEMPTHLLYVSDTRRDLDAAAEAGFQTCWLARDDETAEAAEFDNPHPVVRSFDAIEIV